MTVVIRGRITQKHIDEGIVLDHDLCPLGLSLRAKGMSNLKVGTDAIVLDHPRKGERLISSLPDELQCWINDYDNGLPVEPIAYRLVLE